jgi:hypothetical protein
LTEFSRLAGCPVRQAKLFNTVHEVAKLCPREVDFLAENFQSGGGVTAGLYGPLTLAYRTAPRAVKEFTKFVNDGIHNNGNTGLPPEQSMSLPEGQLVNYFMRRAKGSVNDNTGLQSEKTLIAIYNKLTGFTGKRLQGRRDSRGGFEGTRVGEALAYFCRVHKDLEKLWGTLNADLPNRPSLGVLA